MSKKNHSHDENPVVVTNYLTTNTDLTTIADAIRSKTGDSATLVYPTGMASAISGLNVIKTVSSVPTTKSSDVIYNTGDGSYYAWETLTYTITPTLSHVTAGAENPGTIRDDQTATLTFTADAGYALPASVTVVGATGSWTQETGTLVLSSPTANVTFSITAYVYQTPLCLTANTAGSTVQLKKTGSPSWTGSYSTDGITWTSYVPGTTGAITLTNIGDKVYFKGTYTSANTSSKYLNFNMTGSLSASGNIMSMCSGDNFASATTIPYDYMFYYLFYNCYSLTTAPELPATTLSSNCYNGMFSGCSTMTVPPELPATTLVDYCYNGMFSTCILLATAPELPATELASYCYCNMFYRCEALTTPPELPVTTLYRQCYAGMFRKCTSLTTVPKLPATTLEQWCYSNMFQECTSLYVSDTSGEGYNQSWTIPETGIATGDYTMTSMFDQCLGERSTGSPNFNGIQKTYYTQNTPV